MSIAAVGTGKFANANSFSLTPSGIGNFILLTVTCTSTTTSWATALSGSNVTWSVFVPHAVFSNNGVTQTMFIGKVTSTSAANQTVTFNTGTPTLRVGWQEFSTTIGYSSISLQASGTIDVISNGAFPSVTPSAAGQTYWSFAYDNGTGIAGSSSGYVYAVDSVNGNLQCYNTGCTSSAQTPNIGDTATDGTSGIGVIVTEAATVTALFTTAGTATWVPPSGVTTAKAECWGGGGGGNAGSVGGGGGGGEYAAENSLAVIALNSYTVSVGSAGLGQNYAGSGGTNGGNSSLPGDSVTVTAHGGSVSSGFSVGAGGTGSSNSVHHNESL